MPEPTRLPRPGLSPALYPLALQAQTLGLRLQHFNSGSPRNPANGTRVWSGVGERDFFDGHYLAHLRNAGEIKAFLEGFAEASGIAPRAVVIQNAAAAVR